MVHYSNISYKMSEDVNGIFFIYLISLRDVYVKRGESWCTETRYTSVQNAWDGILKKAGLKGKPGVDKLRLHDLRHTAATNLARAGKDIGFIARNPCAPVAQLDRATDF